MPVKQRGRYRQRGLSLVEIMIALSLGAIVSFGVVNLFLQSKISFYQDEQTAQLQENGRWALRYVVRELSMGGFLGGVIDGDAVTTTIAIADDCAVGWSSNTGASMEHLDNVTDTDVTDAYDCIDSGEVLPGTDLLVMRRTKDSPHVNDGAVVAAPVDDTLYLRVQDFGVSSTLVQGDDITTADKTAGSKVDVWQYQPQLLFIRGYSFEDGDGIPTLCRKILTTNAAAMALDSAECLVEGIENLQVEFGLDTNNPLDFVPDYYEMAPTAAELEIAVTARIYVLSRSIGAVEGYINDKSYNLGGITVAAANDSYYRRVLQTTVMLRNSEAFGF
jgi:type IV pilus assembly protein PilW